MVIKLRLSMEKADWTLPVFQLGLAQFLISKAFGGQKGPLLTFLPAGGLVGSNLVSRENFPSLSYSDKVHSGSGFRIRTDK